MRHPSSCALKITGNLVCKFTGVLQVKADCKKAKLAEELHVFHNLLEESNPVVSVVV
jgi:hypothetical protein